MNLLDDFLQKSVTWTIISLLILLVYPVISNAGEINLTRSKLIQLAQHLQVADPELKYEFSRIALLETYYTYQDEIERAKTSIPDNPQKQKKVRYWRYATQAYLDKLDQLFFLIDSGGTLDFYISPQFKLILLVSGKPIIISGPNGGANRKIEKNVVEQFCQSYDCREYFEKPKQKTQTFVENTLNSNLYDTITGSWSVNKDMKAQFTTTNGIVFQFDSIKKRTKKELWALSIANEMVTISEQLKIVQERNQFIQWEVLSLHDLPFTDNAYKLLLNEKGDFLKVQLSLLGIKKTLFEHLKLWLRTQFKNPSNARVVIENAESFMKG